ncbi:hypothetical protein SLA2020_102460 [Shorea laevis]
MVKLATARESRMYGPGRCRSRAEYINAELYLFATVVLGSGFGAQFSLEPRSSLVLMLIALALIIVVNVHDLVAHLAGVDFRLPLMELDTQLTFVEFAVPLVQTLGSLIFFLGILILLVEEEKGYVYFRFEKHALNMLIAGPVLWVLGSIHNSCQIYERADGHVQILQQSVHLPFLIGSTLFMVGGILNSQEQTGPNHHGMGLLGSNWVWLGISANQRATARELRGGAQERLIQEREGQVPLILDEERRKIEAEAARTLAAPKPPTPYKDVLLGHT